MSLTALQRSQGALVAALAADALGSQFEFCPLAQLKRKPSAELASLVDCGPWHTLAGQPTEDGELMLLQSRVLVYNRCYQIAQAQQAYQYWLSTDPFAVTNHTQIALQQGPLPDDLSASAVARQVPLALLAPHYPLHQLASWAMTDSSITQASVLVQQISGLYVMLLAKLIKDGGDAQSVLAAASQFAHDLKADPSVFAAIEQSLLLPATAEQLEHCPALAGFQNLLFQLQYAQSVTEAVTDTIRLGGDTGTNAVLVAAVFGALLGIDAVPLDWREALQNCRAQEGVTGVEQPRPETFWPVDAMTLAAQLHQLNPV